MRARRSRRGLYFSDFRARTRHPRADASLFESAVFDIQHYASFIAAILIFQAVPGPGTLTILNATARDGARAGLAAVLGTLCGDLLFMLAAVAGLAAVMRAYPLLFQGLQWFGAAYLMWLGARMLVGGEEASSADTATGTAPARFRQAFAVSVTNPKVMLFFVAFFPLFLQPAASPLTLAVMMAHVTLISLAYQSGLVFVGHHVARALRGLPAARRIASRLGGIALIGFGIRLAADPR